jgi:hypothetical protein
MRTKRSALADGKSLNPKSEALNKFKIRKPKLKTHEASNVFSILDLNI